MTKPNKIAPNWSSPETLILDFSRCITSNMTTNNRAPVAMPEKIFFFVYNNIRVHSLIRGILIKSCSAGAKIFTNYVFCHPQFSDVIQNIENYCAILTLIVYANYY